MHMAVFHQRLLLSIIVLFLATSSTMSQPRNALNTDQTLCQALSFSPLKDKIVYPQSNGSFLADVNAYFSNQERAILPSCIVQVDCTEDVSTFVSIVSTLRSQGHDARFAVRSGGHAPSAGSANINGPSATLDLRKLNKTTVQPSRSRVTIGTGATWGDVYGQLDPQKLAVSGGRVAAVGVGGLTLGGEPTQLV